MSTVDKKTEKDFVYVISLPFGSENTKQLFGRDAIEPEEWDDHSLVIKLKGIGKVVYDYETGFKIICKRSTIKNGVEYVRRMIPKKFLFHVDVSANYPCYREDRQYKELTALGLKRDKYFDFVYNFN